MRIKKFTEVKNWTTEKTLSDRLHQTSKTDTLCSEQRCQGSTMAVWPTRPPGVPRPKEELLEQAEDFMKQYYAHLKKTNSTEHNERWAEIQDLIERTGTYDLTVDELKFGTKLAWRNAARCIGRIQWNKLEFFDNRHVTTAKEMFDALCNHIKYATNGGNIRSALTLFPKRENGKADFRVWNPTLLRYAGYKMPDGKIIGDRGSVEFTEMCIKIGWKPKYGMYDILPMVLTAEGRDPEWFDIPPEIILEVDLMHPEYPCIADMGVKWYALPAVSNMLLDVGGIEFPACPFSGWYMGTEIGSRDLCDPYRYNLLEAFATNMGFDVKNVSSLWKDRVLLEVNYSVLYSFQKCGATITDHHSASESFMKHMDNEYKARGGCPADWVWVVPPMSSSACQVFHQEMLNYKLKPSYEYQDNLLVSFVFEKDRDKVKVPKKKIEFRTVGLAIKYLSILMVKILKTRKKCAILYATETGRSENFANMVGDMFKFAFDVKIRCMDDFDHLDLCNKDMVLAITSTFGNGDPPGNGVEFFRNLQTMQRDLNRENNALLNGSQKGRRSSTRVSNKSEHIHLDNVRYSVFGLGSRAYPNFAAFGQSMDNILYELGAKRLLAMGEGDELSGQEDSFKDWAKTIFEKAIDAFDLKERINVTGITGALNQNDSKWKPGRFKVTTVPYQLDPDLCTSLSTLHNKKVTPCRFISRKQLQSDHSERQTILVKLETKHVPEMSYLPGDHLGVYPANDITLVHGILPRLHNAPRSSSVVSVEKKEDDTEDYAPFTRLPPCSLKMALTHFLDVTTPPSRSLLKQLSALATEDIDKEALMELAENSNAYDDWRLDVAPNFLEFLQMYPSLQVPASFLLTQFPLLPLRYYSISSSPKMEDGEAHATIAVLKYRTKGGKGPEHEGVCSSWLNKCRDDTIVPCIIRAAPGFRLPKKESTPVIMVGPGSGVAPFRSFWQERLVQMENSNLSPYEKSKKFGEMVMYFGCRSATIDNVYAGELKYYKEKGVLSDYHIAYSREPGLPKVYVQDVLETHTERIHHLVHAKGAHIYVCGDANMADDVAVRMTTMLSTGSQNGVDIMAQMRKNGKYHEDIFGATFRRPPAAEPAKGMPKGRRGSRQLEASDLTQLQATFPGGKMVIPPIRKNSKKAKKGMGSRTRRTSSQTEIEENEVENEDPQENHQVNGHVNGQRLVA